MPELMQEFQVGVIVKPHGVRGEVAVFPTTDDPKRFKILKELTLDTKHDGRLKLEIESVKFVKKFAVLKFKGFDTVESVERYRSCPLLVDREHATPLSEGEFYIADIIGLKVIDIEDGNELGEVIDVIETGANDVYEMSKKDGTGSVMIPAIKDCVKRIAPLEGVMEIHVMKGLMD